MKQFLIFCQFFLAVGLQAQHYHANQDTIYTEYIYSVKFYLENLENTLPLIELNSPGQLFLTFDDMDREARTYFYKVVHCDADWQPSDLAENEFVRGFNEGEIRDFNFSFNTRTQYTNYRVALPNRDLLFTLSGNYLLHVYENSTNNAPVLTRRFMVVEPMMTIEPRMTAVADVSKYDTHQEIDFTVDHPNVDIRSPRTEVTASVLQNGRWDNAITDLRPLLIKPEQMVFDFQNKVTFPAGREFRFADLRSLRTYSGNVVNIVSNKDGWEVTLRKDRARNNSSFLTQRDLNGNYIIENQDVAGDNLTRADYADVLFVLDTGRELWNQDIYLFGGFSDWQIQPWNQMVWNERIAAYVGRAFLKQGFYNYAYATVDRDSGATTLDDIEGNWYETENQYTILVYYRPFGARYDRLVAARTFDSIR